MGKVLIISTVVLLLLTGCDDLVGQLAESELVPPEMSLATFTPQADAEGETAVEPQPSNTRPAVEGAIAEEPPLTPQTDAAEPAATPQPEETPEPEPTMQSTAAAALPAAAETPVTSEPSAEEPAAAPETAAAATPESTPPSPEELLVRASEKMLDVESYHFDWLIEMVEIYQERENVTEKVTFVGDYQAPQRYQGVVNSLRADNVQIITIGNEVYEVDPENGDWQRSDWSQLDYYGLVFTVNMPKGVYFDMAYLGQELIDDVPVHHISGRLPAHGSTAESFDEFWIGVEDDHYYQVRSEFGLGQEDIKLRITKRFSDHDQPVEIAAPEMPALATLQASPLLGLSYLLPQGWERAAWGEAGCTATNCRGERINMAGDDGPTAGLSLALLDAEAAQALLAELQGYEESVIGGQQALWRANETGLEGILLLADEALQVRGRWGEDPAAETAVRQLLGSILPFTSYEIPGWLALELPADWLLMSGTRRGTILFNNGQADPHEGMADCLPKAEGALTLTLTDEGDAARPPLEMLQDRLAELGEEITVLEEAQAAEINDQAAATVLYQPADPADETFQQLAMIQGPDRTVSVLGSGQQELLAAARPLLAGILGSLQVSAKREPPNLTSAEEIPADYLPYRTTEYRLNYPPDWQPVGAGGVGTFVPGEVADEPYLAFTDGLDISSRLMFDLMVHIDADMTSEELLEKAWELESLISGADIQMVSDIVTKEVAEQEVAAVRVGTSSSGLLPREGVLAVVRRGDWVFTVSAWLQDYEAQRTAVENIISSLEIIE